MKLAEKMNEIYKKSIPHALEKAHDEVIKAIEDAAKQGMRCISYRHKNNEIRERIIKNLTDEGFIVEEWGFVFKIYWAAGAK